MKIIVCIAKVVETTAKIKFTADGSAFDPTGAQYILNPYDEWYSLVRALELKEEKGGEVTVLHVGGSDSEQIIRKALAIGADNAVRIDKEPTSADETAFYLADYLKGVEYDIIFTGKETVDYNGGMVPGLLSGLLGLPFVGTVSELSVEDQNATLVREIEGGTERVKLSLPIVLSGTKDLAEQRIPNMRGIMMAKRKPVDVVTPAEYSPRARFVSFQLPEEKKEITYVDPDQMDELVRLLHEEAKVL